ncbi:MAG TPA: hypothetical protein VNT29_09720 [Candidatus Limnocylindrales bacterium]|nr:hypothetical protein [Candidatus Limnocylindrales bacterium]
MPDESDRLTRSESGLVERQRATPLKPAVWMTSVLVWATVVGLFLHVPTWSGVFLCCLTGVSFLFYLVSYIYLMVADRDTLRSERYREPRVARKRGVVRPRIGAVEEDSSGTATLETNRQSSESTERVLALDGSAGLSVDGFGGGARAQSIPSGEAEPSKRAT